MEIEHAQHPCARHPAQACRCLSGLAREFPANRETIREFASLRRVFPCFETGPPPKTDDFSTACSRIPCSLANREFFCPNRELIRPNRESVGSVRRPRGRGRGLCPQSWTAAREKWVIYPICTTLV